MKACKLFIFAYLNRRCTDLCYLRDYTRDTRHFSVYRQNTKLFNSKWVERQIGIKVLPSQEYTHLYGFLGRLCTYLSFFKNHVI